MRTHNSIKKSTTDNTDNTDVIIGAIRVIRVIRGYLYSSLSPRVWLLLSVAMCCGASLAFAQSEPLAAKPPEVDATPYAPRKLKFRELEEKLPLELKRLDPKTLEQQYVVTVRLEGPYLSSPSQLTPYFTATPEGIKAMIQATGEKVRPPKEMLDLLQDVVSVSTERLGGGGRPGRTYTEFFHLRYQWKPDPELLNRRPSGHWQTLGGGGPGFNAPGGGRRENVEIRFISTSGGAQRQLVGPGFTRSAHEFQFLAPTAAQAKSLAEAFLVLFDQGNALPSRKFAAQWKQSAEAKAVMHQEELQKAKDALPELEKAWEAVKDAESLSAEFVTELTKKKLLLKVEQVGVSTRIAAMEKKIAELEKRLGLLTARDHILGLKEAAEIDLAGLTGQLNEIERLLRTTSDKTKAQRQHSSALTRLRQMEAEVELDKLELEIYDEAIAATAPYKLLDEALSVQPIAWTPTGKKE